MFKYNLKLNTNLLLKRINLEAALDEYDTSKPYSVGPTPSAAVAQVPSVALQCTSPIIKWLYTIDWNIWLGGEVQGNIKYNLNKKSKRLKIESLLKLKNVWKTNLG